jgi:polyisoprenoid-binding protein YceI
VSLLLLAIPVLVGCQAVPKAPEAADAVSRPAGEERPELPEGRRYVVLDGQSEARFVLYPAGTLARLGHPHVIGGAVVSGEIVVAENFHDSGLRLEISVNEFEVDRAQWREDEGFDPEMSDSAIEGTRENMLGEDQLDAANHPLIVVESLGLSGPVWQPDIDARITLAGTARELAVPVALTFNDHDLGATGRFVIRQSDFGITPFSAAGGRLQVADEVLIRFRIVAMASD